MTPGSSVTLRPELILDGLVRVFSTCRSCGHIMQVTSLRDTVHPMCQPRPTRVENWEATWAALAASGPLTPLLKAKMATLERRIAEADESTSLADAAVQYASWGWKVFPLGPRSKKPAIPKSKGGRGCLDGTNDVERIRRWWSRHPNHNIGLATGHLFDVIDVDPGGGGVESLVELLRQNSIPLVHAMVATGGDGEPNFRPSGMHLYVKPTGKGIFANLRPGIDYRGLGGYCVAPPSTLGDPIHSWSWSVTPSPNIKAAGGGT